MFKPAKRNFDKIQHEDLRKKVDQKFNDLHDELSICYYDHWKKGLSKPFQGYDVQPTLEESKALFDKLHGLIFHHHELALDDEFRKKKEIEKTDEEKEYFDSEDQLKMKNKRIELIEDLKIEGFEINI